jgi:hypothetical protein
MKKIILVFILIMTIYTLIGCTSQKLPKATNVSSTSQSNIAADKWEQLGRAYYTEGTVISKDTSSDNFIVITLQVDRNYHSDTDPIQLPDYPFKNGEVVKVMLKTIPKIDFNSVSKVIVLQSQALQGNSNDWFYGGEIVYYEKDGKYYDLKGNEAVLPFNKIEDNPNKISENKAEQSQILSQNYVADLYRISIPKDWTIEEVEVSQEWLSDKKHTSPVQFKKGDKVVGELSPNKDYLSDKKLIPFDMPNHSETTEIRYLDSYFTKTMLIRLERTPPAASGDTTVTRELHICFILKDVNQVYDLTFNSEDVSDQTAMSIAKSFELIPGGISSKYLSDIMKNAKTLDSHDAWITATTPTYDAKDIPSTSGITINFNQDMDAETLNMNNIIIYESKHSRIISGLFKYEYNMESRTLNISFILPGNSYGTGNGINVYVTGDVCNNLHQKMDKAFVTGFSTR